MTSRPSNKGDKVLAILGASGHGKVVADLAEQFGFTVIFYDDAYPNITKLEHWSINGTFSDLLGLAFKGISAVVAIGNNSIREQKINILQLNGFELPILIHPTAVVSKYARIAPGSVVFANAVINSFSEIGKGCIVNTSAVIEHDCILGDFVHICPTTALAGSVRIGNNSWVGIGSQVKQAMTIGENTFIGAGSTVVKDLPSNATAFGSPAVII